MRSGSNTSQTVTPTSCGRGNAEYVRIVNTTGTSPSLQGWTLRDRSNLSYTFAAFELKTRAEVTVRAGRGP